MAARVNLMFLFNLTSFGNRIITPFFLSIAETSSLTIADYISGCSRAVVGESVRVQPTAAGRQVCITAAGKSSGPQITAKGN